MKKKQGGSGPAYTQSDGKFHSHLTHTDGQKAKERVRTWFQSETGERGSYIRESARRAQYDTRRGLGRDENENEKK